jgi:hypothetical protein
MNAYWSYLLTAVGILGLVLAGQKRSGGWAIGLGAQALWVAYAIATKQWGFIASALIYGSVYARNFTAWRREEKQKEQAA